MNMRTRLDRLEKAAEEPDTLPPRAVFLIPDNGRDPGMIGTHRAGDAAIVIYEPKRPEPLSNASRE